MIDSQVFGAFSECLQKEAGWESAVRGVGKRLSGGWDVLRQGADVVGRGGAAGTAARVGLGAGAGALVGGEDNRLSGALVGGALGGFAPTILRDTHAAGEAAGNFVANPAKAVRQGWRAHSPVGGLRQGQDLGEVAKRVRGDTAKEFRGAMRSAKEPGAVSKAWYGGKEQATAAREGATKKRWSHLVDESGNPRTVGNWSNGPGLKDKVQGVADELSRRGWTGKGTGALGGATKYLPVGAKGLTVGFGAMSAPTLYQAATGEIPISAGVGELASNLGYVVAPATKGLGMLGTLGLAEGMRSAATAPIEAVENQLQSRWSPTYRQGVGRNAIVYG